MDPPPYSPPHQQQRSSLTPPPPSPGTSPRAGPYSPYGSFGGSGPVNGWLSADPRTSSTQSLAPSVPDSDSDSTPDAKRKLLIVYIHGFYGNDQSFRSFPAHVHAYLRNLLTDSHVIHSKIYPRYKTYRSIDIARDNFSAWLEPHESPTTDVILVGHSMGGLLAADVVLMPNQNPHHQQPFKHRILGTISLDSPFLGLHPGIIISGLASLVQPAPNPPEDMNQQPGHSSTPGLPALDPTTSADSQATSSSHSTPSSARPSRQNTDPYFDPPFFNDAPFKEQPFLKRMMNFANKHKSEGILKAMRSHILSHLEFGGCLADYGGLNARYKRLRALEDVDELRALSEGHPNGSHARVRFVNYYTLSSGRAKPPKLDAYEPGPPSQTNVSSVPREASLDTDLQSVTSCGLDVPRHIRSGSGVSTPSISIQDHGDGAEEPDVTTVLDSKLQEAQNERDAESKQENQHAAATPDLKHLSMQDMDPVPIEEEPPSTPRKSAPEVTEETISDVKEGLTPEAFPEDELNLGPTPDVPVQPELPDLAQYTDKDARKLAEKESKRLQKAYDQAVKDRAKVLRDRQKLLEKRRKRVDKVAAQAEKSAQKAQQRRDRDEGREAHRLLREAEAAAKQQQPPPPPQPPQRGSVDGSTVAETATLERGKPRKKRKFCTLPGKAGGARDSTWVDVYMEGMDEVSAHCGLFFPGPHYELLVGDVGNRVLGWVQEDLSTRAILEMEK